MGTELGRGLSAACGARNARPLRCPSAGSRDATLINGREEEKPPQKTSGFTGGGGEKSAKGVPTLLLGLGEICLFLSKRNGGKKCLQKDK